MNAKEHSRHARDKVVEKFKVGLSHKTTSSGVIISISTVQYLIQKQTERVRCNCKQQFSTGEEKQYFKEADSNSGRAADIHRLYSK